MKYTVSLFILRGICAIIGIVALVLMWSSILELTERNDAETFGQIRSIAVERAQTVADAMQATIDRFDFTLNTVRNASHNQNQNRIAANALAAQNARFVHIDAQGYIIHSIQHDTSYDSHDYVGNFDYFLRHKNRSGDTLQIGAPFLDRTATTSAWLLPLSRKIPNAKEHFAGVLALYLPLETWKMQFRPPDAENDFIAVLSPNGQFILRAPNPEDTHDKRAPVDWPFLHQSAPALGHFITRDAGDNTRRLIAWNRLPNELIAIAGVALDDALAPAQAISRKLEITGTTLSILIVLITVGFIISLSGIEKFLRSHDERTALHFSLADSMAEGVMEIDAENRIFRVNPAFTSITGYPATAVLGKDPAMLSPEHEGARNLGKLTARWIQKNGANEGDFDGLRDSSSSVSFGGSHAPFAFIGHAVLTARSGPTNHRIVLITDVSTERRENEEIWRAANFDALTRLPNAELMQDHLQLMIHHAALHSCGVAVLFIDLDYFVPISAQEGHEIADRLLYEVARRLRELFHEESTVARLKEDQFVVLLADYGSTSVAERAAVRVVTSFADPFTVDESGVQIKITCSVGLARLPSGGKTAEELLQHAEQAMLRAKDKGRSNWSI